MPSVRANGAIELPLGPGKLDDDAELIRGAIPRVTMRLEPDPRIAVLISYSFRIAPSGEFVFSNVAQGTYKLHISPMVLKGLRRQNPMFYGRAVTNLAGQFTIFAVAPGDYKVFAWDRDPAGAEQNAEFIKKYEDRGRPITVSDEPLDAVNVPLLSP